MYIKSNPALPFFREVRFVVHPSGLETGDTISELLIPPIPIPILIVSILGSDN